MRTVAAHDRWRSRPSASALSYSPRVIRTTSILNPAPAFLCTSGFDAFGSIRRTTASIGTRGVPLFDILEQHPTRRVTRKGCRLLWRPFMYSRRKRRATNELRVGSRQVDQHRNAGDKGLQMPLLATDRPHTDPQARKSVPPISVGDVEQEVGRRATVTHIGPRTSELHVTASTPRIGA